MIGAIIGDMIGSPYEFDRGSKIKDFGPLFIDESNFTDDSVMTIAVADALMNVGRDADEIAVKREVIRSMREWGRRYPTAGYGARFIRWLGSDNVEPYGSWGNGSAMRVSSVGWLYDSLERTREVARWTAEVTHNHPEGIKGAECIAAAIYLLRIGGSKFSIMKYIEEEFGYDFSRTLDDIRPDYHHVESCQETIPEALTAFFEGKGYEDVIRNAVSLGGDCDTLTCIASSIAEIYYGIPAEIKSECERRLPDDMLSVLKRFREYAVRENDIETAEDYHQAFLSGLYSFSLYGENDDLRCYMGIYAPAPAQLGLPVMVIENRITHEFARATSDRTFDLMKLFKDK